MYKDIAEKNIIDIIDKCTMQMYEKFSKIYLNLKDKCIYIDMKELQLVIIRNNTLN